MSEIITVGLDLAKTVFQLHGADATGRAVLRRKLRRGQVLEFLAGLPSCSVAIEACGGAHHWGREIGKLGHEVRLIPPAYVKPFVRRQKNDAADAEAICEAAQRPNILSLLLTLLTMSAFFTGLTYLAIVTIFPERLMETWPGTGEATTAGDHVKLSLFLAAMGVLAGSLGGRSDSRDLVRGALFISEDT